MNVRPPSPEPDPAASSRGFVRRRGRHKQRRGPKKKHSMFAPVKARSNAALFKDATTALRKRRSESESESNLESESDLESDLVRVRFRIKVRFRVRVRFRLGLRLRFRLGSARERWDCSQGSRGLGLAWLCAG